MVHSFYMNWHLPTGIYMANKQMAAHRGWHDFLHILLFRLTIRTKAKRIWTPFQIFKKKYHLQFSLFLSRPHNLWHVNITKMRVSIYNIFWNLDFYSPLRQRPAWFDPTGLGNSVLFRIESVSVCRITWCMSFFRIATLSTVSLLTTLMSDLDSRLSPVFAVW